MCTPGRWLSTTREDEKRIRDNPQYQQGTFRVRPGYLQELCHFAIGDGQMHNSYIYLWLRHACWTLIHSAASSIHCVNECDSPGVNAKRG